MSSKKPSDVPKTLRSPRVGFSFESPIPEILHDLRQGKMVVVMDDASRENEGDLVMAAAKATAADVNFMARYGRGLICVPVTRERAAQFGIPRMVAENRESFRTDFTVSVDAAEGIASGISAADRAATIKILADPNGTASQLVQPGHIFPLQAKPGGVLQRAGHTEAAVDLVRLADLDPSAVICEILRSNGTMARRPHLLDFCKRHSLKMCSIRSLIEYRRKSERLINALETIQLPTKFGDFQLHLYESRVDGQHHVALVRGPLDLSKSILVRVHSECLTGDVFGSCRCDCGGQLEGALQRISEEGSGVLLYMKQEGRGIGLAAKIQAYKLQEQGMDTVQANLRLGFPNDLREYGLGAQILADLGVKSIRLLTNNPRKIVGLAGYGIEVAERVPLTTTPNSHNRRYLKTKQQKLGHLL